MVRLIPVRLASQETERSASVRAAVTLAESILSVGGVVAIPEQYVVNQRQSSIKAKLFASKWVLTYREGEKMTSTLSNVTESELTYDDLTRQIYAEIGRTFKGNVSAFARALDMNRPQLIKYLDGGVDMGTQRLLRMIRVLGLTEEEFFRRARQGAAQGPTRG